MRDKSLFIVLILASVCSATAEPEKISESALEQIRALEKEKFTRSSLHQKLDSQFVFKLKQNRGQLIASGVAALQPDLHFETDGRILIDIEGNVSDALLNQIRVGGGTVINSFAGFHAIRALVPLGQLETLAGLADVKFIKRAGKARTNTGSVTSEGDTTHRANVARSFFGATGHGIKVGVLSDSIDFLSNSQATGDLGDVTVLPGQSGIPGSGEGTAMLEIVHDLAPEAQLYFATAVNSEASFAQNILTLRSNGCDVIIDDVYYFDEPPFQDGVIAQAVNSVTAGGALYFSAAGNDGNFEDRSSGTWEGDFVDGGAAGTPVNIGGGNIHSFGAATFNTLLTPGYGVDLFWSDPLGGSSNDYDLFLLDSTGSNVVASSLNLQNGTQDPYENISSIPSQGQRIVIVKSSGSGRFLHLVSSRGALSISTAGATRGHSTAAGAFSVAAVNALSSYPNPFSGGNANPVERFSSDGPRRIFFNPDGSPITPGNFSSTGGTLRQKPDITAADGVQTSLFQFAPFFGTSAAAAHAGAIAAQLLSYDRNLTPGQLRTALTSTALDIESSGVDSNSGAGIIMAYEATQSLPLRPVILGGGAAFLAESCLNGALDPGERVTVALTLTNVGPGNTSNLVATLLASGGVTLPSGPQYCGSLPAKGGTFTCPFSFTASGACGQSNVATLQLQDGTNNLGTASFTFPLGRPRMVLSENFDEVLPSALPPGWLSSWSGAGSPWHTINGPNDSPPTSVFVADPPLISDNFLISPVLSINGPSAQLTFRHSYNTAACCDYGILQISINGGPFTDILAAGGSFTTGGYNTNSSWRGNSGGFVTTSVNLPAAAAGEPIQLRWRLVTSGSGGAEGWYLDSMVLTDGINCCVPIQNDIAVGITTAPNPVVVNENVTYSITVVNTGPAAANNVTLVDVLPPSVTLVSATFSPSVVFGGFGTDGGTLIFNVGAMPGGSSANITIVATPASAGLITNRAAVTRGDADATLTNNTAVAVTEVIPPILMINDVSLFDGSSGSTNAVFTLNLSAPVTQPVTVNYATSNQTALAGSDYVPTNGTIFFSPGMTNQTLAVAILGDTLNKPNKTFLVALYNPTNAVLARSHGTGTIVNDDPLPSLSVNDTALAGVNAVSSNAIFNVTLNPASGQTVTASGSTSNGTAIAGIDYVPEYPQLTFNPGETNKTVIVPTYNHISAKPNQTFYLYLSGATNAKLARDHGLASITTAQPGQADHFSWNALSSPQIVGAPAPVTISAQDFFNNPATNFSGSVVLSANGAGGPRTNSMFDSLAATSSANTGTYTIGNSFTPNANILVTHFRHYSGTKVSLWSDAGVLLASQPVSSVPGTWVETPLSAPLQLLAGQTYRLGFYTGGATYYGRFDLPRSFSNGTINQTYFISGDAFPNNFDSWQWIFVDLRYIVQTQASIPINPTNSTLFTNGVWSGTVTVQQPCSNIVLSATDSNGDTGASNPFEARPLAGQVTHFTWAPVSSPQYSDVPFTATVTAQDFFNATATNFNGQVTCTGSGLGTTRTNTMFDNLAPSAAYSNGLFTIGYAFTPSTDIMVTHLRSYSGTKVSLWNNSGVLLVSQNVSAPAGNWSEMPLSIPLHLVAGQTYRLGLYTGGTAYYGRFDQSSLFSDGVITQAFETSGDAFPTASSPWRWIFVDIRYTTASLVPVVMRPAVSASFINGVWSGSVTAERIAANLVLSADDGVGHNGLSNPFDVVPSGGQIDHLAWSAVPSTEAVGEPFAITLTAQDFYNGVATNFNGNVAISSTSASISPASSGAFANGVWTGSVAILQKATNLVLQADDGNGHSGLSNPLNVASRGQLDHFSWNSILSPQSSGVPFPTTIVAQDYFNNPITNFTGRVVFNASGLALGTNVAVSISPTNSANFINGMWSGSLSVPQLSQPVSNVVLIADNGSGQNGSSAAFDVLPGQGQIDHLVWNPISSPEPVATPFNITITAQDYYNRTATNFNGLINLSALGGGAIATSTILPAPSYTYFSSGAYTLGYAFTPNTNLTVTHVRHYFGSKVSIWTDGGALLGSQNVSSVPGAWSETALSSPLNLAAGVTYRVAVYTGGGSYYFRADMGSAFPYGNINRSLESTGDTCPVTTDSAQWWLVDLKYTVGWPAPIPITPTTSGNFSNGIWSGSVTVTQKVANLVLQGDDGNGHTAASNPFNVASPGQLDHFAWAALDSPEFAGGPIPVSITAQDSFNNSFTNFIGPVSLSASGWILKTNSMFDSLLANSSANNGTFTYGNAFTPNVDIVVTHFRHYSGSKVSLWTDAGVLIASQNVTSIPGTWVETPLSSPIQLLAGQTYRVGFYTAGSTYYGRNDLPSGFADGTISQTFYNVGDGFPNNFDSWRWIFVDLKYVVQRTVTVPLSLTNSGLFINASWNGNITVPQMRQPVTNVTLLAFDGNGHSGLSNPFNLLPGRGQIDHLVWSPIASPKFSGVSFGITVTAQDYYNSPAIYFNGPVALSGSWFGARTTNTILPNPVSTSSYTGDSTVGYAFTPNSNLTVTHVRHFFGSKVSIWSDTGVLLASQNVTSMPGGWVETPLITPLQLTAGVRYRVGSYSAGGYYYFRSELGPTFPNGTINQSYEASGDAFPATSDTAKWWFVDLRYTISSPLLTPISPNLSGNFTQGVWSGRLIVPQPATNFVLVADDGNGHSGASNPFDLIPQRPVVLGQPANQISFPGGAASLNVLAAGTAPLVYQWYKNGGSLAGATNSVYRITNAQISDAGFYNVTVSNLYGSVISSNALLIVTKGGTVIAWGDDSYGETDVPAGLQNVAGIAGGVGHTLALHSDGSVAAWGDNSYGQTNLPPGLSHVVAVAAGYFHSLALRSDGTIAAWGDNSYGQASVPVGLTNVAAIACGGFHSLALRTDGTVASWGYNAYGETTVPPGLSNVIAIAGGGFHTLALRSDGSVSTWGYNFDGEANVPAGLDSVVGIAGGRFHSLAVRGDGTVAAWGDNRFGQSTVPAGLTNIISVAARGDHSLALRSDGSIVAWGNNLDGEALAPSGLSHVFAIASGFSSSLALVVNDPPLLLTQPKSQIAIYGANPLFGISYGGAAPLSFQWQKNGSNLPTATSSALQLTAVTRADEATYLVTLTNTFGSITSSNAFLRVLVPQQFKSFARDQSGAFHFLFADGLGNGLANPANVQVQAATNFLNTNTIWTPLTGGAVITNGLLRFDDPAATNFSRRFYRVIEQQ